MNFTRLTKALRSIMERYDLPNVGLDKDILDAAYKTLKIYCPYSDIYFAIERLKMRVRS